MGQGLGSLFIYNFLGKGIFLKTGPFPSPPLFFKNAWPLVRRMPGINSHCCLFDSTSWRTLPRGQYKLFQNQRTILPMLIYVPLNNYYPEQE